MATPQLRLWWFGVGWSLLPTMAATTPAYGYGGYGVRRVGYYGGGEEKEGGGGVFLWRPSRGLLRWRIWRSSRWLITVVAMASVVGTAWALDAWTAGAKPSLVTLPLPSLLPSRKARPVSRAFFKVPG